MLSVLGYNRKIRNQLVILTVPEAIRIEAIEPPTYSKLLTDGCDYNRTNNHLTWLSIFCSISLILLLDIL